MCLKYTSHVLYILSLFDFYLSYNSSNSIDYGIIPQIWMKDHGSKGCSN